MPINGNPSGALAVVLAGGNGTRLDPLTRHICKPALPFGGVFRSIDFALSNCVNSRMRTVAVATQYKPQALLRHLAEAWRSSGGEHGATEVIPWHADSCAPATGYCGTADAVYRNLERIDGFDPELVLILAGDHVYKMDYRPMLDEHRARRADVTIGCVEVPVEDARHFGVMSVDAAGCIERFIEKPRSRADLPNARDETVLASMGIYVFDAAFLRRVLTADAAAPGSRHDFGNDLLPKLIGNSRVFAHAFRGTGSTAPYWRDIGTIDAYWRAHMDLLGPAPLMSLTDAAWPIGGASGAPRTICARVATPRGGEIEDSLVGPGCTIAGHLRHSVLFGGAEVGRGVSIVDSVVLPGARIGAGSRLRGAIVGAGYHVPEGTVLERDPRAAAPLVLSGSDAPANRLRHAAGG